MTSVDPHSEKIEPAWQLSSTPIVLVWIALMIWCALSLTSKWAYQPPRPRPKSVGNHVFSAERAERFLQEIVGDGIPHPAGSTQNTIVGDRIKRRLESFGYEVQEQMAVRKPGVRRTNDDPTTVPLRNLLTIKKGNNNLGSVMLVAHYDSVPYGPGACDDGVAVAALLEVARMATTELRVGREVIFLFTDGEEYNLLGARAFVEENEISARVEFVVNFEARGTSGPSLMFQTSADSSQIVSLFSKSVRRPVTSSLFEEVYKRLPNDSDFTIFRDQANMRGLNFAFIGDAQNYHTDNDNFENASRSSLQHHGENAWGLLQNLVELKECSPTDSKSVYFDFYGRGIIRWEASVSKPISVVLFALVLVAGLYSSSQFTAFEFGKACLVLLCSILIVAFVTLALDFSYRLQNRFSPPWIKYPTVVAFAFWCLGIASNLWLLSWFKLNERAVWVAVWIVWSLLGALSAFYLTGACYLFLIPTAIAVISKACLSRHLPGIANVISASSASLLWMPLGVLFYDALGFATIADLMFRMIVLNVTLLPLIANTASKDCSKLSWLAFATSIVAVIVAIILNPAG